MLALILTAVFGVQVLDSGSTVRVDTVSAVLTMSELRAATVKLADYVIVRDEIQVHEQRHVADSTALQTLRQAYTAKSQALDSSNAGFRAADSARIMCLTEAGNMDREAQARFRLWVTITGAAGIALSVLTFLAGMGLGG